MLNSQAPSRLTTLVFRLKPTIIPSQSFAPPFLIPSPPRVNMPRAFFALGTILTWSVASLVLRRVVESWPLGMAGVLSRVVTVAALGGLVYWTGRGVEGFRLRGGGRPFWRWG